MAHAQIPEPGTYCRVLIRTDRDKRLALNTRFRGYNVSVPGVALDFKDHSGIGLFFPNGKEDSAQRAVRLGWKDITKEWMEFHQFDIPQEVKDARDKMREVLLGMDWDQIRALAKSCGISATLKRNLMTEKIIDHKLADA